MKKLLLIVCLAILSITSVYAEGGRGSHSGGHVAGQAGGNVGGHAGWHGGGYIRGHGGNWGGGWIVPALIGGSIAYDLAYPYPLYDPYPVYTPPPVYVQPEPDYSQLAPVYAPGVPPPSVPLWYFCAAANGYYPYVTSCPGGWQAVPAKPPVAMPNVP